MAVRPRTITLTEREFDAIVDAAALIEAQYEDDDQTAADRRTNAALERVIAKWYAAAPARPAPPPMLEVDKRYPYGH